MTHRSEVRNICYSGDGSYIAAVADEPYIVIVSLLTTLFTTVLAISFDTSRPYLTHTYRQIVIQENVLQR